MMKHLVSLLMFCCPSVHEFNINTHLALLSLILIHGILKQKFFYTLDVFWCCPVASLLRERQEVAVFRHTASNF